MGQLALGFRSLLIKAAIFVVMAALLAWALGGTLLPRPLRIDEPAVAFNGAEWYWRLALTGRKDDQPQWLFMREDSGEKPRPAEPTAWAEPAGPVVTDDAIVFAGRVPGVVDDPWSLIRIHADGEMTLNTLPDRLSVEVQLERARTGMPMQLRSRGDVPSLPGAPDDGAPRGSADEDAIPSTDRDPGGSS